MAKVEILDLQPGVLAVLLPNGQIGLNQAHLVQISELWHDEDGRLSVQKGAIALTAFYLAQEKFYSAEVR